MIPWDTDTDKKLQWKEYELKEKKSELRNTNEEKEEEKESKEKKRKEKRRTEQNLIRNILKYLEFHVSYMYYRF